MSGYHDLATPFWQTELDLARLGDPAGIEIRVYPGGHMTYLDDGSRRRLRDDVAALLAPAARLAASAAAGARSRGGAAAMPPHAGSPPLGGAGTAPDPASVRTSLCPPGGDPWLTAGAAAQRARRRRLARRRAAGAGRAEDRRAAGGLPSGRRARRGWRARNLEVGRVLVAARTHRHQDAALADAVVVLLDALFRDAPADQRADDAAGRRTGTGAGDRRGERAGDDEAETRQRDRRADRGDRRGDRAQAAADRAANAGAFGRLRAELGLAAVGGAEVALARLVGHHEVDVLARVAAVGDRLVGALGAVAVAEQSGEDAACWSCSCFPSGFSIAE